MKRNQVEYDSESDALYVRLLANVKVAATKSLDDLRMIDYSADGRVIGIEFLNASDGIDLSDIPFSETVERLLGDSGHRFKILTH